MLRTKLYAFIAVMLMASIVEQVEAARSEADARGRTGVVRCGGNNFLRLSGTEVHTTTWSLRNLNETESIIIDRFRIFNARGVVLFDSLGGSLPSSNNGVLGPSNNMLNPNQSAHFSSDGIIPFLALTDRGVSLEVNWSAARPALSLDVVQVRIVRERDPSTGAERAERSRFAIDCRTIFLR